MSPKKVRLVGNTIRGLDVDRALDQLQFTRRNAAPVLAKLLRSAIANAAHNNNLQADLLMVKNVEVNQGIALKRWRPAAFGSAHEFKKPSSHITITLALKAGAELPKSLRRDKAAKIKKIAAKTAEIVGPKHSEEKDATVTAVKADVAAPKQSAPKLKIDREVRSTRQVRRTGHK